MSAGRRLAGPHLGSAAALLAGALFAVAAAAQEAPSAETPVFGETVDVRVINVEVVVTDADGNRVPGLGRDDFRLTVDGEEVAIDYFTEVRGGTVAVGAETDGAVALPPGTAAGAPAATHYLVYIDDLMTREPDRDRALERLRDQLPHLGPADRMAVVAFDGRQLEMLSTWTGSAAELDRVLRDAAARRSYDLFFEAERRANERDRRLLPPGDPFDATRLGHDAASGEAAAMTAWVRP